MMLNFHTKLTLTILLYLNEVSGFKACLSGHLKQEVLLLAVHIWVLVPANHINECTVWVTHTIIKYVETFIQHSIL